MIPWRVTYRDPKTGRDITETVEAMTDIQAVWYIAVGLREHGMEHSRLLFVEPVTDAAKSVQSR